MIVLVGSLALIVAVSVVGCCKFCQQNKKKGLARILCQPMDRTVFPGTNAEMLAIRQGEIDATCGLFESTVRSSYMHDFQSGERIR